jgi:hypothetical protein
MALVQSCATQKAEILGKQAGGILREREEGVMLCDECKECLQQPPSLFHLQGEKG